MMLGIMRILFKFLDKMVFIGLFPYLEMVQKEMELIGQKIMLQMFGIHKQKLNNLKLITRYEKNLYF